MCQLGTGASRQAAGQRASAPVGAYAGVADKADLIKRAVGDDADLLVCLAWLHDIGYAPGLAGSGFHPLDGARYLRDSIGADDQLCRLVANHSCARLEARRRGIVKELAAEFPETAGIVPQALTYCDMTTSPDGEPINVEDRLRDIVDRYGEGHIVAESIKEARSCIREAVRTVSGRLGAPRPPH